jgi:arylsulfatase
MRTITERDLEALALGAAVLGTGGGGDPYIGKLMAARLGPWKFHFSTKEDYYANAVPRTAPLVFNIRMDPFESYDTTDSYGHLVQKVSWLVAPMSMLMKEHLKTLAEFPPVQGGTTFDMSNVVEQFLRRGHD